MVEEGVEVRSADDEEVEVRLQKTNQGWMKLQERWNWPESRELQGWTKYTRWWSINYDR